MLPFFEDRALPPSALGWFSQRLLKWVNRVMLTERRLIAWSKHDFRARGLITAHLPVGPVFEIADRELLEEWIGIDELFTRCPAGRVGARNE